MTGRYERIEVITGVERRRRWSVEEKLRIVTESLTSGVPVSVVARRHGVGSNLLFRCKYVHLDRTSLRREMEAGAL